MDDLPTRLRNAADGSLIVRVERDGIEEDGAWTDGFVMTNSEDYLLLQTVNDRIFLDGYEVLRVSDITTLHDPTPYFTFQRRALELRKQKPIRPPAINMDSLKSILKSVSCNYPLVVVHRELADPDVCAIGKLESLGEESFQLREVDPEAEWHEDATSLAYDDVTRIGFDGGYENALALVAGITGD